MTGRAERFRAGRWRPFRPCAGTSDLGPPCGSISRFSARTRPRWPRPAGARPLDAAGAPVLTSHPGSVTPKPATLRAKTRNRSLGAAAPCGHPPREPGTPQGPSRRERATRPDSPCVPRGRVSRTRRAGPSFPAALAAGQGGGHVTRTRPIGRGCGRHAQMHAARCPATGASRAGVAAGGVLEPLGQPPPWASPALVPGEPRARARKRDEYQRLGPCLTVTSSSHGAGSRTGGGGHSSAFGDAPATGAHGVRGEATAEERRAGSGRPAAVTVAP